MSRRSFALYINLNGKPVEMNVSEFLVHLLTIADDSEKEKEANDFILNLQEEMSMIAGRGYLFPNCMRFLKDAIETVRQEKWKFAKRACKSEGNSDANVVARGMPVINNEIKNVNEGQTDNVSNESFVENDPPLGMSLEPIRSDFSIQPEDTISGPNVIWEMSRRHRMVWSDELHRKFRFAVDALGGPREAKPKDIHDRLKIDGLTTEQIKSHLQRYRKQLNYKAPRRPVLRSNHNMQTTNTTLVRRRFSLLCMQRGESSNSNMTRARTNKKN